MFLLFWMGKQICDVQGILEEIGDKNILLQLGHYESYLNVLKKIDIDGHIREAVSPGDCTDLCSTVDQELGSFVKEHFNKAFKTDFGKRPDAWQTGKVPAKERRKLFTIWTCDAVAALMQRRDIIRRAFRGTGVGIDIDGKMKNFLRFPGFETYVQPEKDEGHTEKVLTTTEIEKLKKKEIQYQERKKARNKKKKIKEKRKRAKKRTENI